MFCSSVLKLQVNASLSRQDRKPKFTLKASRLHSAGPMALLTNVTILLVLACISHQLTLGSCQKSSGRTGRRVGRKQHKDRPGQAAQPVKGKLVTKDKLECTWAAAGDDVFVVGVSCKKGGESFSCQYAGRPTACPQYASNVKLFWRQVARALKKHKSLCQDGSAAVRVGMCRGADRDAHFRLLGSSGPTPSPQPAHSTVKSCQPHHKRLAEEYCHDSWASVCTFFFTMLQDYDC